MVPCYDKNLRNWTVAFKEFKKHWRNYNLEVTTQKCLYPLAKKTPLNNGKSRRDTVLHFIFCD